MEPKIATRWRSCTSWFLSKSPIDLVANTLRRLMLNQQIVAQKHHMLKIKINANITLKLRLLR